MTFDSKIPSGRLQEKWDTYKDKAKLVNPANKRKFTVLVVGTGLAGGALGEGRLDAAWGLLGMLAGGGVYAVIYPTLKTTVLGLGNLGKVTLPQMTGLPHWVVIAAMAILFLAMFRLFEKKGL